MHRKKWRVTAFVGGGDEKKYINNKGKLTHGKAKHVRQNKKKVTKKRDTRKYKKV